jgi:hypothetical protein
LRVDSHCGSTGETSQRSSEEQSIQLILHCRPR